jgi:hypothetical protein
MRGDIFLPQREWDLPETMASPVEMAFGLAGTASARSSQPLAITPPAATSEPPSPQEVQAAAGPTLQEMSSPPQPEILPPPPDVPPIEAAPAVPAAPALPPADVAQAVEKSPPKPLS